MSFRYVMTYTRTADTLAAYEQASLRFPGVVLVPVPNQISRSCGLAVEFPFSAQETELLRFWQELPFPTFLYQMELEKNENGALRVLGVTEKLRNVRDSRS